MGAGVKLTFLKRGKLKDISTAFDDDKKQVENRHRNVRLDSFGQQGVESLRKATPVNTGTTASSWSYEITKKDYPQRHFHRIRIAWNNSNLSKYIPVALLIQYGHATKNGGYVAGRDYINPAIQPIYESMANKVWKDITWR